MTRDTTKDAARAQIEALSRLSGEERLQQALELSDFVFEVHLAGVEARARDHEDREAGRPDSGVSKSGSAPS